jgi:cellulose synthase/poly-beta-1,6-N-acetylglucosamine synthase-like glycosyltransferase
VINNLISEFIEHPDTMLVSGNSTVFPPKTFFQKAIYSSYLVYYKSRNRLKNGQNAFSCTGACLALKKEFARKIDIPKQILSEDTYIYLFALKKGYKYRYAKNSVVYFKMAANLKDFLRQMLRSHTESVHLVFRNYFGELVDQEFKRPLGFYLKSVLEVFLKNPFATIYMVILKLLTQPLFLIFSRRYKLSWWSAVSSK